jgi:presenilin-like A22 family membrane protease
MSAPTRNRAHRLVGDHLHVDRQAVLMVVLFLSVSLLAMWLAAGMATSPSSTTPQNGVDNPAAGAGLAIVEALFALSILGVLAAYRHLPEVLQRTLRYNGIIVVVGILAMDTYGSLTTGSTASGLVSGNAAIVTLAVLCVPFSMLYLADQYDVYWLFNNVFAFVLAVSMAAVIGYAFSTLTLLAFLAGLTVYDWYFADRKDLMFQLLRIVSKFRLPLLFIKPAGWCYDWHDNLVDFDIDDDETEELPGDVWGIGTADVMLAAAVPAAVYSSPTTAYPTVVAALVVGGILLAVLRLRKRLVRGDGGAGLPAIASGVIGAYAVGIALSYALAVVG